MSNSTSSFKREHTNTKAAVQMHSLVYYSIIFSSHVTHYIHTPHNSNYLCTAITVPLDKIQKISDFALRKLLVYGICMR